MTKKTQPDNSEVFERALDAATNDPTPKSDITAQLAVEGMWLLEIGYPEASKVMLDARDEIKRLRNRPAPSPDERCL